MDAYTVGNNILETLKKQLGDQWNQIVTTDRDLIDSVCQDAGRFLIMAQGASSENADEQKALLREKSQIDAQLANIVSIGANEAARAFWTAFNTVINGALTIGMAALGAIV